MPISWDRVEWIAVGWGGLDFYTTTPTWSDLSLRATLRGIFGDGGVLRIDVYGPLGPHPGLKEVRITADELDRLTTVILADLTRDPSGAPIAHDSPGFTTTDRFFYGQDRFSALYTCNAWVGASLRAAGLRLGAWTPTPYALTLSLARYGHLDHDI